MSRHLVASLLLAAGCFDPDVKVMPDGAGPTPDAPPALDAPTDAPLPAGFRVVATGNYLALAPKIVDGLAFAIEYSSTAITAQPLRIVSIDVATGTATPLRELPAGVTARDLQANATGLYWLEDTNAGGSTSTSLFYKPHGGTADALVTPTTTGAPSGKLDAYLRYGDSDELYLLYTKGNSYELGTVPPTSSLGSSVGDGYSKIGDGSIPNTSSITFADISSTIAPVGNIVYAGGHATSNFGFVQRFNTDGTSHTVQGLANTWVRSFWYGGVESYWLTEDGDQGHAMTLHRAKPIGAGGSDNTAVADLPLGSWDFGRLATGAFYVVSLDAGHTRLSRVDAPQGGTATTTLLGDLATCEGQTSQDCTTKIPSIAVDATASTVVFGATTAVYAYTP